MVGACVVSCLLSFVFFRLWQSLTLHTDLGDVKIELQCELVPNACEVNLEHGFSSF